MNTTPDHRDLVRDLAWSVISLLCATRSMWSNKWKQGRFRVGQIREPPPKFGLLVITRMTNQVKKKVVFKALCPGPVPIRSWHCPNAQVPHISESGNWAVGYSRRLETCVFLPLLPPTTLSTQSGVSPGFPPSKWVLNIFILIFSSLFHQILTHNKSNKVSFRIFDPYLLI